MSTDRRSTETTGPIWQDILERRRKEAVELTVMRRKLNRARAALDAIRRHSDGEVRELAGEALAEIERA
jgi:hypothetical protein